MRYELLIGLRYLSATRQERVPSVIALISVVAVAVGVAVLLVVLGVLGGFEADLRSKILASKAHILVTGPLGGNLEDPAAVLDAAARTPGIVGASPFIESDLMVSSSTNYSGIVMRGIDPTRAGDATDVPASVREGEFGWLLDPEAAMGTTAIAPGSVDDLEREIEALREIAEQARARTRELRDQVEANRAQIAAREGSETPPPPRRSPMPALPAPGATAADWQASLAAPAEGSEGSEGPTAQPGAMAPLPAPTVSRRTLPGILIGAELKASLYVEVGDVVELIHPDGPVGPTGPTPMARRFRVVGVFYTGLFEYDSRMAYVLLDEAQSFLRMQPGEVTGVEIRVSDMDRAGAIGATLHAALPDRAAYEVSDWTVLNSTLFSALMLEKFVMGFLLMIIVLVASFAIVCVLIMIVIRKSAEIGVLRAMGVTAPGVMRIFLVAGGAIGLVGTVLGALFGLALVWWMRAYGIPLDPAVYYISRVPVDLDLQEIVGVVAGSLLISLLATLYPSMQAARLDPAAALRNE